MSEQDLAKGIDALADEEVRGRVADGDLSAAGELELTDEEADLLIAAASDEPEVVGFGINTSLGLGLSSSKITPTMNANRSKVANKAADAVDAYIRQ